MDEEALRLVDAPAGWSPAPPKAADNGGGWEVVSAYRDDFAVFPPSRHEGLHLRPSLPNPPQSCRGPEAIFCPSKRLDGDEEKDPTPESRRRLEMVDSARYLIGSMMDLINSKIASHRGGGRGGGAVWSFAALAGLVGTVLYFRRCLRRERDLLLLIQQKDQRINRLLRQIAQMDQVIGRRGDGVSVLIRM